MQTLVQPFEGVTQETVEKLAKSSEGILAATGIEGIDLAGLVALIPVNVPARNNTSAFPCEIAGMGSETAQWKALLNINEEQGDIATGFDYAASLTKFKEQTVYAPYKPMGKFCRVTLDSVAINRNYADALAVAQLQTLNQLFIGQDIHIINSQNWELARPTKPTLTAHNEGGEIGESEKVTVSVAPRSGGNYFFGKAGQASEAEKVSTASGHTTCSVTAKHAAVKGACAYDWYVGKEGGKQFYYTTTTVAEVTVTKIPTKAEAVPSLPLISSTAPSAEPPAVNESASTKWYNGVIASNLGDYGANGLVTPGSGTPSGCQFIDAEAKELTASGSSIPLLDELFEKQWNAVQLSPTALMMNTQQGEAISKLLLEGSIATTFLPPTEADARTNLAGGGFVGRYINKAAGGVPVNIEVHPHVAPGTIISRTDRVPFPGSNIGSVYSRRCQYDTMEFQYAASRGAGEGEGARYDSEVRSMETLINRAPSAQGVVANIKANATI